MTGNRKAIEQNEAEASICSLKTSEQSSADPFPSVAIIILNYNNWTMTEQCLLRLFGIEYPNYRVIVVDNGSERPCPEEMSASFPEATFLSNRRNAGYSEGCNYGIRHAHQWNPDYIWLLNNDTEAEPGSLKSMVRLLELHPEMGAAGSVLRDPGEERKVQAWGGGSISFLSGLPNYLKRENNSRLDFICGASLLFRAAALNQIGLLDPGFFLYWEDVDICFRLRAAGWSLGVANTSSVIHRGSATAIFQSVLYDYHFTLSSIRFFQRHYRHWWLPALVSLAGRAAKRALYGRTKNSLAVWAGFRDAFGSTPCSIFKPEGQ